MRGATVETEVKIDSSPGAFDSKTPENDEKPIKVDVMNIEKEILLKGTKLSLNTKKVYYEHNLISPSPVEKSSKQIQSSPVSSPKL